MRNLVQFPPTKTELLKCLTDLEQDILACDAGCGDTRPMLLRIARDIIAEKQIEETLPWR